MPPRSLAGASHSIHHEVNNHSLSLCPDPSRCTGSGHEETFKEHLAVEVRRSRWGHLKEFRFSGRCQSAGSSRKSWSVPGSPPFLLKQRREAKKKPSRSRETGPQRRKHQDQRHNNSNHRAPTEHPKAFLSLLGNAIQQRLQRNSKPPRFRIRNSCLAPHPEL